MAKSLRSKRKRKVRAEKRIVNAKKELVKLREIAAKLHGIKSNSSVTDLLPDVEMRDVESVKEELAQKQPKGKAAINPQWMNQRRIKRVKRTIKKAHSKKSRSGNSSVLRSRKSKKK